ncbi:uncharacterized protein LOC119982910 [Tripterygium wilfordii]|uniref:uncharacterized protein LOC119982910 n=1 Tax=Tripterygium wilfordii TaxID=458696 RepID=UPI0018F85D82|nr:uncharacterized protein LOC119982910 [Tripterygium wilfordii]
MDHLTSPKYFPGPPSAFLPNGEMPLEANPFADNLPVPDPLCELSLKETSEFVKSFPAINNETQTRKEGVNSQRRLLEAPSTPGRPVFSFGVGNRSRKGFPSKWDDAEKWLMSSSCHDSPSHAIKPPLESSKNQRQCDNFKQQMEVFAEKSRVTEEKVSKVAPSFQHNSARAFNGFSCSTDVFLKDKFTDNAELVSTNSRYSEPSKEGFLFGNSAGGEIMLDAHLELIHEVQHRDVGTEMTPLGSSTTSRCHTPFKSYSPARHNTPASRSGPLDLGNSNNSCSTIDIAKLQECHLAKLQLGNRYDSVASNWVSREEEEEEISKSLRHIEISDALRRSVSESRAAVWEEEDKTKCCLRYQREEAKIQAWVNLQNTKAEAQSRKLEVKIQKMKSKLEEKLMKRMADMHRKAEEWRVTAREQHTEQMNRAREQGQKMMNRHNSLVSGHSSCGCFPCRHHYKPCKKGSDISLGQQRIRKCFLLQPNPPRRSREY